MNTRKIVQKVTILGDAAVGKTSLVRRYVENAFSKDYISTVGATVSNKKLMLGPDQLEMVRAPQIEWDVELVIWDLLGQKGYNRVFTHGLDRTAGIVIVCDMTYPESVDNIWNYWLKKIPQENRGTPIVILANKMDLVDKSKVGDILDKIAKRVEGWRFLVMPTSALSGENVEKGFGAIAKGVVRSIINPPHARINFEKSDEEKIQGVIEELNEELEYSNCYLLDMVIDDFISSHPKKNGVLPAINKVAHSIGLNLNLVTKVDAKLLIDNFAEMEKGYLKEEEIKKKQEYRISLLESWE